METCIIMNIFIHLKRGPEGRVGRHPLTSSSHIDTDVTVGTRVGTRQCISGYRGAAVLPEGPQGHRASRGSPMEAAQPSPRSPSVNLLSSVRGTGGPIWCSVVRAAFAESVI